MSHQLRPSPAPDLQRLRQQAREIDAFLEQTFVLLRRLETNASDAVEGSGLYRSILRFPKAAERR